jgi:LAS superfamily LD-carboxypeptidase LdcB
MAFTTHRLILGLLVVLLLTTGGFLYREYTQKKNVAGELASRISESDQQIAERDTHIKDLKATIASTTDTLKLTEDARANLESRLADKESELNQLANQVEKISGTVGVLDKLAKVDKELLIKYSKIYFLNENYKPAKITQIDQKYSAVPADQYLESHVYSHMTDMIDDAKSDGVDIKVRSAYRSFDSQKNLKSAYSVRYGTGANTFSADQGYSEHQLGTTADLTSSENDNQLAGFDTTKAYAWLLKHAYKYGFIISYPKGNAYYIYEPWHWRFVGKSLASDLHDENKNFYDLDQREINKYLVSLFD